MESLGATFGTAALVAFVLENLKKASWFPWLTVQSSTLNAVVAVVAAFGTAIGLNYMWDETTRMLTVHVPTLGGFLLLLWQFGVQWAIQKFIYRTGVKVAQPVF